MQSQEENALQKLKTKNKGRKNKEHAVEDPKKREETQVNQEIPLENKTIQQEIHEIPQEINVIHIYIHIFFTLLHKRSLQYVKKIRRIYQKIK